MQLSCVMRIIGLSMLAASPVLGELKLEPTLHMRAIAGESSADHLEDLASHGHDPNNNFALQGLDLGTNLHYGDDISGFVNMNAFSTPDHKMEAEWEEGFLKYTGVDGFEIRGGRFLNRLGGQNNQHLHSWDFVDANLSTGLFLGEEGLRTDGGELTWMREFDTGFFTISGSFGEAVEHGHEEEDEHDEGDHDDEEEHGHGEESENAYFSGDLATIRVLFGYNHTDFHQHRFGLNGAWGENGYGHDTSIYSTDYTYTWREKGLESGGKEISLGLEYYLREVEWEHAENASNRGKTSQSSVMGVAKYRFSDEWVGDFRYGWIEGVEAGEEMDMGEVEYAFASEERKRLSLALTREIALYKDTRSCVRLQYNHDDLEEGSEDSVWLQFGFDFGPGEVR